MAYNPKSKENLNEFQPGKSGNPNGRPKKLVNVIKRLPSDMQEKVYGVLAFALTLSSEREAKLYLEKESEELGQYGFVLQIAIKQLLKEGWGWNAMMDIFDRLYGRPRETKEIQAKGEGLTIIVKSQDEKDKIDNLGGLDI